jgi:hypothetical protein
MATSERLARRFFALLARRETQGLVELLHPDVEIVLKSLRPGEVLHGREAVAKFIDEVTTHVYESHPNVFRPLDDERVVVEGRLRWMDDQRVLRDDPVIWAIEFRDGLLYRSLPAQSVLEAESLVSVRPERRA